MKAIHERDPDHLMKKAQRIKLNPRKMKKLVQIPTKLQEDYNLFESLSLCPSLPPSRLEKDYHIRRERQAMENMELLVSLLPLPLQIYTPPSIPPSLHPSCSPRGCSSPTLISRNQSSHWRRYIGYPPLLLTQTLLLCVYSLIWTILDHL